MTRKQETVAVRLAVALLLAGWAEAQNNNNPGNNNNNNNNNNNQPATTAAQQTTNQPQQTQTQQQTQQQTNTPATTNAQTNQQATSQSSGNTNSPTTTAKGTTITNVPNLSSSSTSSTSAASGAIGDVPTIAGYGIPTMIVPWTGGAPFMAKSNMPEGTIFIAVGALLGAMGAAVLLWRAVVAWSLHRSVKRANQKLMGGGNISTQKLTKASYTQSSLALGSSNMSLDHLSASQRKTTKRNSLGHTASAARNSSLFFSPTAGAGHQPSGTYNSINRSSGMLPSGFYAAPGAAAPNSTFIGGNGTGRAPYGRTSQYNSSPPDSPRLPPSRGNGGAGMYTAPSTSTLNLHVPGNQHPGGRAPSANLDDLFGNDPAAARR